MHRIPDKSPAAFINHDPQALIYSSFSSKKLIEQAQALAQSVPQEPGTLWRPVMEGVVQRADTFPAGGDCEFPQQVTHSLSVAEDHLLYVGGSMSLPRKRDPVTFALKEGHDATMPVTPYTLEVEITPERLQAHLIGNRPRLIEPDIHPFVHQLVLDSLVYTLGIQEPAGYQPPVNRIPMLALLFEDPQRTS